MREMVLAMLALATLARPAAAGESAPRPGRVVTIAAVASVFVAPRTVRVWLPVDYDTSNARYAVLYMHDGQNLFDPSIAVGGQTWSPDVALADLAARGAAPETIVVGVDNTSARLREYMPRRVFDRLPGKAREVLARDMGGEPLSDAYLMFLVFELKPMIDRRFRTRPGRSSTSIMGSSMGALISLYALTEYPRVFFAAGCLSTHWPLPAFDGAGGPRLAIDEVAPALKAWLRARLPAPGTHRIWFDHGDRTLDRFYPPYQESIDRLLTSVGWVRGRDFESRVYPGAAHDEASWRARLEDPLEFLLAPAKAR